MRRGCVSLRRLMTRSAADTTPKAVFAQIHEAYNQFTGGEQISTWGAGMPTTRSRMRRGALDLTREYLRNVGGDRDYLETSIVNWPVSWRVRLWRRQSHGAGVRHMTIVKVEAVRGVLSAEEWQQP